MFWIIMLWCFKNNTVNNYKLSIPEDKVLKLNQYFENKDKKGKGYLITKLILSRLVRKFISRFFNWKMKYSRS